MRPLGPSTHGRELARTTGRARNLERRYIERADGLPWAIIYNGSLSQAYATPGGDEAPFDTYASFHDPTGIFSVTGGSNAKQLGVNAAGIYLLDVEIAWEEWGGTL